VLVRQYLADVLPGLADRSIQSLAELTPMAYAAKMTKQPACAHPGPVNHAVAQRRTINLQKIQSGSPINIPLPTLCKVAFS